ncbi:MAG TPA: DUF362 domain-containing protein [Phycisphaerae bacterium]|nr:DUF362 domain-containing protein [Phycisphaerae bacterium]HRY70446.1 DUF362 domain-containing protein [Phycisphaerae bacterium]HSA27680.1 DUF362 domain-containing protein [Phycisphaerae bacterium]
MTDYDQRPGLSPHGVHEKVWDCAVAGRFGRWLWHLIVRSKFAIAVASLIWLLWRSGSQPRRLAYPCQQAAAANLGALAVLLIPAWARCRKAHRGGRHHSLMELATGSVALAGVLSLLVSAGVAVYSDYGDSYTPGNPALVIWPRLAPADLVNPSYSLNPRVLAPNAAESVVAVNRDDAVTYGTLPYGPGANTAYDLVWRTVADLNLGPWSNPLRDLVADVNGDGQIKVVIKPNWVEYYPVRAGGVGDAEGRSPAYTHPAMARPLVDMAVTAGATEVVIGDSSGSPTNNQVNSMGYPQLCSALAVMYPGRVVGSPVNFQDRTKFTWVTLAGASSYTGSGYLSSHLQKTHDGNSTAYFGATDGHGTAGPGKGNCVTTRALTDYLLDADLIIDLPKMKVHYHNPNTLALKNWVGATMLSTFNNTTSAGQCRVAHYVYGATSYQKDFGNDILWRELLDLHRSFLYWRRGAGVQPTQQRRYLCVLDAIVCGETDLWYNGGPTHWRANTILASVDPVAIDAVGSRIQGYRWDRVPIVNNANVPCDWPIGTSDPGKLRVVSGTCTMIDGTFSHLSIFDDNFNSGLTWPDWNVTALNDLTPPAIHMAAAISLGGGAWQIEAEISDSHVAYYYYGDDGTGAPRVVRLGRTDDHYVATVRDGAGGVIVAQDEYFNTSRVRVAHVADFDSDGDVDGDDVGVFQACLSGPSIPPAESLVCRRCDFDVDADVDQSDFGIFQRCCSGSGHLADPNCAD